MPVLRKCRFTSVTDVGFVYLMTESPLKIKMKPAFRCRYLPKRRVPPLSECCPVWLRTSPLNSRGSSDDSPSGSSGSSWSNPDPCRPRSRQEPFHVPRQLSLDREGRTWWLEWESLSAGKPQQHWQTKNILLSTALQFPLSVSSDLVKRAVATLHSPSWELHIEKSPAIMRPAWRANQFKGMTGIKERYVIEFGSF